MSICHLALANGHDTIKLKILLDGKSTQPPTPHWWSKLLRICVGGGDGEEREKK